MKFMKLNLNSLQSYTVQGAMENLLKMINEIEVQSADVKEEIEKCKESVLEKRKAIEDERECYQKAAFAVLDVLNSGDGKQDEQMLLEDGREY
ncbi:hypothetical protein RND81_08G083500 [Saponaria officinalis]|uniref:Uncharacterized protein n=1 Tax=Saponaria officinalis TaxID=3572 RepID=A0AAW1J5I1_SAPOF